MSRESEVMERLGYIKTYYNEMLGTDIYDDDIDYAIKALEFLEKIRSYASQEAFTDNFRVLGSATMMALTPFGRFDKWEEDYKGVFEEKYARPL